jgi:LPXTG-motif cell wall-anchored protein
MAKFAGLALFLIGTAGIAAASPVPEIDPASGVSALALLSGALLVFRARRKN